MGISPRGLAVLDHLQYDKRVIERDRSQSTFSLTFLQFQAKLISDNRMSKAQGLLKKHAALFSKVQKKYGVPGAVLVAFWGLETDFGSYMGDFKTIQSLATLAYDCRRPEKFRPQVFAALADHRSRRHVGRPDDGRLGRRNRPGAVPSRPISSKAVSMPMATAVSI